MRIGVDARRLAHARLDGRLSYLVNGMQNILRLDQKNEYVFFVDGPLRHGVGMADRVVIHQLPYRLRQVDTVVNDWWRFRGAPRTLGLSGCHLIVDPYPRLDVPYVISANDLTLYHRHHRCHLPFRSFLKISAWRQYNRLSFASVVRRARRIHCITHFMKAEFIEHLKVPESVLKVIYPGGDNEHFRVIDDGDAIEAFRKQHRIDGQYVMAFGNKNLNVLLNAYSRLPRAVRNAFSLVVTGPTFETDRELIALTERLGISSQVRFFNYFIPHSDLVWFYNAASLFVLPSQYEMFCNMIVEAMRCRCPVLASRLMPNVELGAASIAYYEGVNDAEALSAAMLTLLESEEKRAQLAEAGHVRGAQFTWENYAREMLSLYEEAFA